jgi:hypothetical protein
LLQRGALSGQEKKRLLHDETLGNSLIWEVKGVSNERKVNPIYHLLKHRNTLSIEEMLHSKIHSYRPHPIPQEVV